MKQNNVIILLTAIMVLSLTTAFVTPDASVGKLLASLGIISGVLCSGQILRSHKL